MSRFAGLMVVAVGLALTGCGRAAVDPVGDGQLLTTASAEPAALLVANPEAWRHDAYEFVEAKLTGDLLEVTIRYGGGCAEHAFALLVSPVFMESDPVQMRGSLAHNGRGDPCRALLQNTLRIDLTPLKEAWWAAYGAGAGTIRLRVDGWPQDVVYSF
jgi:hypothetical protein